MRILVLSLVLHVAIATIATAQTVIVRHAAPGTTVELVLDAEPAGTGTVGADGNGTIVATTRLTMPADVNVWVDDCGDTHRVILARRGVTLPASGACRRTQIPGLYVLQGITSLVVDIRGTPTLLIRQGPVYDDWLRDPVIEVDDDEPSEPLPPLTGLALFGTVGRGTTLNFRTQACGTVTCSMSAPTSLTGGAVWWISDVFGVDGRYTYFASEKAEGSGTGFQFTTTREGGVAAFTGRAGVRGGRFRPFGRAGFGLYRATLTTTQTVDATTVTIDGVEQAVPGGTQTIQMRTKGWAPVYGGGLEIWLSPRIAILGEAQRIGLKGADERNTPFEVDDAVITATGGITIRF